MACYQSSIAETLFFTFWFVSPFIALAISIYVYIKLRTLQKAMKQKGEER